MKSLLLPLLLASLLLVVSQPVRAQYGRRNVFKGATAIFVETPDSLQQVARYLAEHLRLLGYEVQIPAYSQAEIVAGLIATTPPTAPVHTRVQLKLVLLRSQTQQGPVTGLTVDGYYCQTDTLPVGITNRKGPQATAWAALQRAAGLYPGGRLWYDTHVPADRSFGKPF